MSKQNSIHIYKEQILPTILNSLKEMAELPKTFEEIGYVMEPALKNHMYLRMSQINEEKFLIKNADGSISLKQGATSVGFGIFDFIDGCKINDIQQQFNNEQYGLLSGCLYKTHDFIAQSFY